MKLPILLACCAVASAGPLAHKPAPAKLTFDEATAFATAFAYEAEGKLSDAIRMYASLANFPEAAFNTGVDELAHESSAAAEAAFVRYLKLAPEAADASAVKQVIQDLAHGPVAVTIETDDIDDVDPRAILLVDRVVVPGHTPLTLQLPVGTHTFERIWPGHYSVLTTQVADHVMAVRLGWPSRRSGNVVLAIPDHAFGETWREGTLQLAVDQAMLLPVGHYKVAGPRRDGYQRFCAPIEFDVVAANEMTYVQLEGDEPRDACWTPKRVVVQRLLKGSL